MKKFLTLLFLIISVNALYVEKRHNDLEIRAASCTSGSYGLRKGNGYNGYCCKTQADCWDDCIKGVCNGPRKPTTTKKTTTKTTTTKKTTTIASCTPGSYGLRRGNSYKGYCCKTQADCWDDCVKGQCTGPKKPSTTKKTTTTTSNPATTSVSTSTSTSTTSTTTTTTSTIPTTTVTSTTTLSTTTTGIPPITITSTITSTTTTTTTTTTATPTQTEPALTLYPMGCSVSNDDGVLEGVMSRTSATPQSCARDCDQWSLYVGIMRLDETHYTCYCYMSIVMRTPSGSDNRCIKIGDYDYGVGTIPQHFAPNSEYVYAITDRIQ